MKYLLIDDHPVVLEALATQLGVEHKCLLASSLREGLELAGQHRDIDLIILDLGLPDSNGMQGLMRLRAAAQSTPVLVLSGSTDHREIQQALELGAAGFVPKTTATSVLKHAIELVLGGGIYLPPQMLGLKARETQRQEGSTGTTADLTAREKEIVPLLALGLSNKAIANRFGLSENTIRAHVASILKKMNVENRAQVASKLFLGTL